MYASIRKYYITPDVAEEFMRRVQQGFVPLIKQVKEFRSYYALQVQDDEVISVSIFDSQAGAEESVRRSVDWVAQNLSSLIQGLPEIWVGYVKVAQSEAGQPASIEETLREQLSFAQNP